MLGLFKFTFHNKHIVYMHDTPTKRCSSGQCRAVQPRLRARSQLRGGELVLGADKGWTPDQVKKLVSGSPVENPIRSKKLPVHLVYFTEVIADNGDVVRYPDVYGHEQRVVLALAGRFRPDRPRARTIWRRSSTRRRATVVGNRSKPSSNNLFGGF